MWIQNTVSTPPAQHYKNNGSAVNEREFVGDALLELLRDNRIEEVCSEYLISFLYVCIFSFSRAFFIFQLRNMLILASF